MKYLPLIWAGLWRKPLRTIFTLLSIIIAFLLFGLLQGVNAAFTQGIEAAGVDRLIVESRIGFTESLPYADLAQIEAVPGVSGVAFASFFIAEYQEKKNAFAAFPVDPERYFALTPELSLPADQLDTFIHTRTGVVVGQALAVKYGWKIGDRLPLHSRNWTNRDGSADWNFEIVGIFRDAKGGSSDQLALFNHAYFDEARSVGKGTVGWYIVRIADPHQSVAIAAAIDQLFANSPDETRTMTEKEFGQAFLKQFGDINFIVVAIIGAVFFTLLFLTGNTMMQSVRDRIPEFAVLKTLGYSENLVLSLILAEALVLCIGAALVGLALAAVAFPQLKRFVGTAFLPTNVVLAGIAAAIALAIIVGLPPALRARRLSIVDALAGR
ncbi:MAG: putative transport system permease protein [Aliidongia sp.]|jgi:putative ABC transport system permease protein|nr:putative transport system permease protein [Aliidongia sp.]